MARGRLAGQHKFYAIHLASDHMVDGAYVLLSQFVELAAPVRSRNLDSQNSTSQAEDASAVGYARAADHRPGQDGGVVARGALNHGVGNLPKIESRVLHCPFPAASRNHEPIGARQALARNPRNQLPHRWQGGWDCNLGWRAQGPVNSEDYGENTSSLRKFRAPGGGSQNTVPVARVLLTFQADS